MNMDDHMAITFCNMVTQTKQTSKLKQPQTQIHHTTIVLNCTHYKEFV